MRLLNLDLSMYIIYMIHHTWLSQQRYIDNTSSFLKGTRLIMPTSIIDVYNNYIKNIKRPCLKPQHLYQAIGWAYVV